MVNRRSSKFCSTRSIRIFERKSLSGSAVGVVLGRHSYGLIDDVRVYARALTSEEVAVLATARDLSQIAAISPGQRTSPEQSKMRAAFLETGAPDAIRSAWQAVEKARLARDAFMDGVQTVMIMEEAPNPKDTFILNRGAYDRPGEKVSRGVPAALHPLPANSPANRLGLARWLVDSANPLTARVAVNRFWQGYFGTGIVKTVEDFGSQGEWPSHPELLDWLATDFVQSGWDVKRLQKTIVMSATYRQSSADDDGAPRQGSGKSAAGQGSPAPSAGRNSARPGTLRLGSAR